MRKVLEIFELGGVNMSFNNYSAQDPMFPSGDGREDMLGRDLLSRRSIDPMLLEALMEDYGGKKRKKKGKGKKKGKKKEQKVRLLRLEQMVAQVNYQNGVLSHCRLCRLARLGSYRLAEDICTGLARGGGSYLGDYIALSYRNDSVQLTEVRHAELVMLRLKHTLLFKFEINIAVCSTLCGCSPCYTD